MAGIQIQSPGVFARHRAAVTPLYAVMPPEGVLESRFPNFTGTLIRVLTTPARGSGFAQMLLEIAPGGGMQETRFDALQHFFYVVEGSISLDLAGKRHVISAGGFAYAPSGTHLKLANPAHPAHPDSGKADVIWIQKPYEAVYGITPPAAFVSHQKDIEKVNKHTQGRTWQHLLPDNNLAFDFAVNILAFEPGNYFPMVETHVMEHGLYMLEGQGMYLLQNDWHECWAKDFIYMAPFCPQFFYATGWSTASYLLYKDVNRDIRF